MRVSDFSKCSKSHNSASMCIIFTCTDTPYFIVFFFATMSTPHILRTVTLLSSYRQGLKAYSAVSTISAWIAVLRPFTLWQRHTGEEIITKVFRETVTFRLRSISLLLMPSVLIVYLYNVIPVRKLSQKCSVRPSLFAYNNKKQYNKFCFSTFST